MDKRVTERVQLLSTMLDQPELNQQLGRSNQSGVARDMLLALLRSTEHPRFEESLGVIIDLIDTPAPRALRAMLTSLLYNLVRGPFSFPGQRASLHAHVPAHFRPDDAQEVRFERALTAAVPTWLRLLTEESDRSVGSFGVSLVELLSVLPGDHQQICGGLRERLEQSGQRGALLIALARQGDRRVVDSESVLGDSDSDEEVLLAACSHALVGHASPLVTRVVSSAREFPLGANAPFIGGTSGELLLRSLTRLPSLPDPDAVVRACTSALGALPPTRGRTHAELFGTMLSLASLRRVPIENLLAGRVEAPTALTPLQRRVVRLIAEDTIWDAKSIIVRSFLEGVLQQVGLPVSRAALKELGARD